MKTRFSRWLVLFISMALFNSALATPIQTDAAVEEYAVYDAVIAHMFAHNKVTFDFGGNVTVKELTIISRTVEYPSGSGFGSDEQINRDWMRLFPNLIKQETFEDYRAKSKQPAVLKRSFRLGFDYVLIDPNGKAQPNDAQKKDGEWYAADGRVRFSRVGFDREHNQALVYMDFYCGSLCGHGFYLLVTKNDSQWTVTKVDQVWIS